MNYVIGDSHVSIFSGQDTPTLGFPNGNGDKLPRFNTGDVSARLAYSFGRKGHPVTEAVDGMLKNVPAGSTVIFSFGEIDCRCHTWNKGRGMTESVENAVGQYMKALGLYLEAGFDVYALLPHVIKRKEDIESASGTWSQITAASMLFNTMMKEWNEDRCISLFEWTFNYEIFLQPDYYRDDTHLSQRCLPFMLAECQEKGVKV